MWATMIGALAVLGTRRRRRQPAPGPSVSPSQAPEIIAAIVIHGNQVVTDEEVLKIAGIAVGAPFTSTTIAEVTARLKAARKFESVEVLKRYASIDDFSKITVVINASEGAVRITNMLPGLGGLGGPKVVKRNKWRSLMGMAVFDAEDGYGVTYGVRLAYPKVIGPRSRLSFPLTWGGTRKAGVELEKSFTQRADQPRRVRRRDSAAPQSRVRRERSPSASLGPGREDVRRPPRRRHRRLAAGEFRRGGGGLCVGRRRCHVRHTPGSHPAA